MISKFTCQNHPILGDLSLNFCKDDGIPYKNIVLIGENGCGKSTILRLISNHFAGGRLEDSTIECVKQNGEKDNRPLYSIGFCYSSSQTEFSRGNEFDDGNYKNASDLDEKTYEENCDEKNIKYLLLNIKDNDSLDLMDIAENESRVSDLKYLTFKKESRVYRFTNAFNNFFEKLKLVKIDCREKKIIFEKNGKNFEMVNLSTGEKQIVMRGASILKNLKKLQDGVVLIDEPEIGMHPRWEKNIMKYYENLVTINGNQTTQIIFATHSEFVVEAALNDKENTLVILLSDINGKINSKKITGPFILPKITSAEVNYEAFHIASKDYHNQLYAYLQKLKNVTSVKKTDDVILQSDFYNNEIHSKDSSYRNIHYKTLPTYIRNAIDHPDNGNDFTDDELEKSIELLKEICSSSTN